MIRSVAIGLILIRALAGPPPHCPAQSIRSGQSGVDSLLVARIINEEMRDSRVMQTLESLTSTCGPRLSWSPGFEAAMSWATQRLREFGVTRVHRERWAPVGRGWTLKRYQASIVTPFFLPLISYPKAWSPGTPGRITGRVLYLNADSDSALSSFRGKLKGTFVLLGSPSSPEPRWRPDARRLDDTTLLLLANSDGETQIPRRQGRPTPIHFDPQREYATLSLCVDEGVAGVLTPSRGDGGTLFVESAAGIGKPGTLWTQVPPVYGPDPPRMVPQATVAAEHFNRLVRLLKAGQEIVVEMSLEINEAEADSGSSVFGEIPGTDLREEVVMIGAHLDSWHAGTGATDNGAGVAVCMEAMRLLASIEQRPRRTIRIALWGGEEQGLLGSRAYVRDHYGERPALPDTGRDGPGMFGPVRYKPAAEKFSVYFNIDNGAGRIRGVSLQGNDLARPLVRSWLAVLGDPTAATVTLNRSSGSDHASFAAIGLPAFQFIQDHLEYFSRTWHSNMDTVDRVPEEDLRQASIVLAVSAYAAAMRGEKVPRTTQSHP